MPPRYFHITERGSSISVELRAGFSTFLTIAYILVVNPQILSGAGLPINEVTTSTALSSALATLMCGLFANLPFAVAPGMGLNGMRISSMASWLDYRYPITGIAMLAHFILTRGAWHGRCCFLPSHTPRRGPRSTYYLLHEWQLGKGPEGGGHECMPGECMPHLLNCLMLLCTASHLPAIAVLPLSGPLSSRCCVLQAAYPLLGFYPSLSDRYPHAVLT